ncbi:hypothetical protein ACFSCX_06705 [Bacillus salitolerans]|uniref:Uncharacterized protein n=1 Tax=Bacillus salitolerans TaxID=1437434 RepID=A0ABW4LNB2_9BACI
MRRTIIVAFTLFLLGGLLVTTIFYEHIPKANASINVGDTLFEDEFVKIFVNSSSNIQVAIKKTWNWESVPYNRSTHMSSTPSPQESTDDLWVDVYDQEGNYITGTSDISFEVFYDSRLIYGNITYTYNPSIYRYEANGSYIQGNNVIPDSPGNITFSRSSFDTSKSYRVEIQLSSSTIGGGVWIVQGRALKSVSLSFNQKPTLTLSTPNNQTLSAKSGKNSLHINGTVNDQDTGNHLLIKYSIDGLSGYQNKVLP